MSIETTRRLETPVTARLRRLGAGALVAMTALAAGCSHAPGMYMDAKAASARVDFKPIDAASVRQLDAERRARQTGDDALPTTFVDHDGTWDYRIAPQDVLRVTVWGHPDLSNPHGTTSEMSGRVVDAKGQIFFPHLGTLQVGGRTVEEVRDRLTRGLSRVLRAPQVDVSVMQYRGQRVQVAGEVRQPGTVAVTDVAPTLPEIIARAGGPLPEADLAAVSITRGNKTLRVDLQALYADGSPRANVRLMHGDIVNIPDRRATRVFVTGEVLRPTALAMPRGELTLADALSDAGGVNPLSANAGQVYVIRGGADASRPQVYHLNAAAPDALLLADQFPLRARDVVYVDVAPVARWSRMINNILPTANLARDTLAEARTTR